MYNASCNSSAVFMPYGDSRICKGIILVSCMLHLKNGPTAVSEEILSTITPVCCAYIRIQLFSRDTLSCIFLVRQPEKKFVEGR